MPAHPSTTLHRKMPEEPGAREQGLGPGNEAEQLALPPHDGTTPKPG